MLIYSLLHLYAWISLNVFQMELVKLKKKILASLLLISNGLLFFQCKQSMFDRFLPKSKRYNFCRKYLCMEKGKSL